MFPQLSTHRLQVGPCESGVGVTGQPLSELPKKPDGQRTPVRHTAAGTASHGECREQPHCREQPERPPRRTRNSVAAGDGGRLPSCCPPAPPTPHVHLRSGMRSPAILTVERGWEGWHLVTSLPVRQRVGVLQREACSRERRESGHVPSCTGRNYADLRPRASRKLRAQAPCLNLFLPIPGKKK